MVDENATCDLLQEGEELIRLDSKSTFTSVQSRWHDVPPTDNIEREKNNLDPAVSINAGLSESEGATAGLVTNLFFLFTNFYGSYSFGKNESRLLRRLCRPLYLCVPLLLLLKGKIFTSTFFICAFPLE